MRHLLSEFERKYVTSGAAQNIRADGRGCMDYRQVVVETGVLTNTYGSARVQLSDTFVLVGVKAEIGVPLAYSPKLPRIEFSVDWSTSYSNSDDKFELESVASELEQALYRLNDLGTICIGNEKLCILPGKQVWVIFVDVLILSFDGNIFDVASMAVKAALSTTLLPVVSVDTDCDSGVLEIEVSDDPSQVVPFQTDNTPIMLTLTKISDENDASLAYILDATSTESECQSAQLVFAVNRKGYLCTILQSATGVLRPNELLHMVRSGKEFGMDMNRKLEELLEREKQQSNIGNKGFLRGLF